MSKIVIFGGSGFIGSAFRSALEKRGRDYTAPTLHEINLIGEDAAEQVSRVVDNGDTLVMIAAYTQEHGVAYELTDWNVCMAANVMAGIEGKSLEHCVYISSDSVYGDPDEIITEKTPVAPVSLYGHMHVLREAMFRERFAKEKLTILRPCAIYGPKDTHNAYGINQFVRNAINGRPITLFGNGEEMRSNIYIDDVAMLIAKCALEKKPGVFNLNCGEAYSFRNLAEIVVKHTQSDIAIDSRERTLPVRHRFVDSSALEDFGPLLSTHEGIKNMIEFLS